MSIYGAVNIASSEKITTPYLHLNKMIYILQAAHDDKTAELATLAVSYLVNFRVQTTYFIVKSKQL